ncbi:MAG TPA: EAL domain-containing protein [Lysobacter sp.]
MAGLGFAVLYFAGCAISAMLLRDDASVTLFWPAAGIGLAGVVRHGLRSAWFIPLALLVFHLTLAPVPPLFVWFSLAANTLAALAGGWVASRHPFGNEVTPRWATMLLLGGVLMSLISTAVGVTGLHYADMLAAADAWTAALRWFLGNLLGVIAVTPALLLRARDAASESNPYKDYGSEPERLGWLVLLVASYLLMAWGANAGGAYSLGVTALPLAMLTWSAMRFPLSWTARATLCTCLLIGAFAGFGMAGFTVPTDALETTRLLGFLCVLAALPLMLSVASHERRVVTRHLLHSATIDPITGLRNRTAFEQLVRERLAAPGAPPQALAYLDLDNLKLVNDTASHAAGDELIRGIAGLLQADARPGDLVGRLGGDEFAVLLHNCLPSAAEERARQWLRAIESYRCEWEGRMFGTSASIGLVPFQGELTDYARLLSHADAACFAAKELGGNQVCRAALDGGERLDRTQAMRWAIRVRESIENHGLVLYAQAIAPLRGPSAARHFEVLLRVRDPATGELLLPGQFFAAAARFRLGVSIDREVVEMALHWLELNADPDGVESCCINLSAEALVDESFIGFLGERLRRSTFPLHKLCLEITESTALRDIARAQRFIAQMRALGCRFALDDFGTGFCSFAYLRSLDVDYFKIDGSFVRELHDSPLALSIVRAITDIAHVLDKRTIAEHTENVEQLAVLARLGVDHAQGFVVHMPEPIEDYFARTLLPAADVLLAALPDRKGSRLASD